MTEKLYHGSTNGSIKRFDDFSHFGTRAAALAIIAAKICPTEDSQETAFIYSGYIDMSKTRRVLKLQKDFGSPRPLAVLRQFEKQADFAKQVAGLRSSYNDTATDADGRVFADAELLLQLRWKLKGLCVAISYPNEVEAKETQHMSYVVVCGTDFVAEHPPATVSAKEIWDAWQRIPEYWQRAHIEVKRVKVKRDQPSAIHVQAQELIRRMRAGEYCQQLVHLQPHL
ncbi:hypothetical protein [Cupriavidus sp. AcVe19-6a]|uniref:hypothetical protein n=1 Tax=Cupriavidus sp. AcVe19-6a TaxID=2821358 RepID=UPI001AE87107|nr:hypothetical protein [Cupriavidus sp. AcVe19-6a]MBP0639873.1 hypothetical protein [Cupriavidus sp. AcVe19-6a]